MEALCDPSDPILRLSAAHSSPVTPVLRAGLDTGLVSLFRPLLVRPACRRCGPSSSASARPSAPPQRTGTYSTIAASSIPPHHPIDFRLIQMPGVGPAAHHPDQCIPEPIERPAALHTPPQLFRPPEMRVIGAAGAGSRRHIPAPVVGADRLIVGEEGRAILCWRLSRPRAALDGAGIAGPVLFASVWPCQSGRVRDRGGRSAAGADGGFAGRGGDQGPTIRQGTVASSSCRYTADTR